MTMMDNPKMMHTTYFTLPMGSTPNLRDSYIQACSAYLSKSEGMLSFWAGMLAENMFRTENDRGFNIAMNQIFENEAMFKKYNANDTDHNQFVIEVDRWAQGTGRRVLDSFLSYLIDGKENHPPTQGQPPRLLHSIYFSLEDKSLEAKNHFIELCKEYLFDHPGLCIFALGSQANMKRDVSIVNYDVAMNILWKSKACYSSYLTSKSHAAFLTITKGAITDTHIFDSYLVETSDISSI